MLNVGIQLQRATLQDDDSLSVKELAQTSERTPGSKEIVDPAMPLPAYHVKSAKSSGSLTGECGEPSRGILAVAEFKAADKCYS